jgi:acylphosphatase
MSERRCVRLRVHGLVQGVGFRHSLQRQARQGPALARVERVEVTPDEGRFDAFEQLPTA